MKISKVILSILILLTVHGCKKKHTIEVNAINPVTGEGYSNLGVQIEACRSGAFEDKCKVVYTGYTNENGNLLIDTRLNESWRHDIYVDLPNDYCYSNGISEPIFDNESDNHEFTFERAPCAFLKLKIENVNCQGSSDKFVLFQGNQIGSFNFDEPWEHNGCVLWESNGYSSVPMGKQYYKWEVTRNNTTETFQDTIYLEAGEQRVYEINY